MALLVQHEVETLWTHDRDFRGDRGVPEVVVAAQPSETREAVTGASPNARFRDLQAYRGELRATLDGLKLDDVHDTSGNALYRP